MAAKALPLMTHRSSSSNNSSSIRATQQHAARRVANQTFSDFKRLINRLIAQRDQEEEANGKKDVFNLAVLMRTSKTVFRGQQQQQQK